MRGAGYDRQRGPQFVTGILRERLLALQYPLELVHVAVERGRDDTHLLIREPFGQRHAALAGSQVLNAIDQLRYRAQHRASQ